MNQTTDIPQQDEVNRQPGDSQSASDSQMVIPVIEEQVHINKKVVETGRVNIFKKISEQEQTINIPVTHEEVQVERVPVNQYVPTAPPPVRYEGDTMIIPILREVLVVEKRLELVEEIRVTRSRVQTQETQQVSLRKEEVTIERTGNNNENNPIT